MPIDIECDKAKKLVKEMCDQEVVEVMRNFAINLQTLSRKYSETMVVDSCTDFVYELMNYADDETFGWFRKTFHGLEVEIDAGGTN